MKPKANHLLDYLHNPSYRDPASNLVVEPDRDRLFASYMGFRGGWPNVIRLINGSVPSRSAVFPDANVILRDDTEALWQALRASAFGREPMAVISAPVKEEVAEWVADPWHHQDRANVIRAALQNRTWLAEFGVEDKSPIHDAILGYTRLFGLRRYLAQGAANGRTLLDTDAADKSGTMSAIGNKIGRRAESLARKGRQDIERLGQPSINDELHCLLAIAHALLTGKHTVLLTADLDLVEIFWKAQWFLDMHYRAWLAAKLVDAGEFGEPAGLLEETEPYFNGPVTLYRRQTQHLLEVLPRLYRQVWVMVIYVGPDGMIQKASFPFEQEMIGMLETRSETSGRCTDLFGKNNIHVDLGPLKEKLDGLYLGIGPDAGDWVQTNSTKTFLALLDQEHSMNCRERSAP